MSNTIKDGLKNFQVFIEEAKKSAKSRKLPLNVSKKCEDPQPSGKDQRGIIKKGGRVCSYFGKHRKEIYLDLGLSRLQLY